MNAPCFPPLPLGHLRYEYAEDTKAPALYACTFAGQGGNRICHAEASFGAEAHAEAATALAELYVHLGQPAAALEILYSLQGVGAVLSPHSPAVWPLHWRRASLFMKLGHTVRSTAQSP